MMGDALRKVQAGQRLRIPARAYNAFIGAVRDLGQKRHDALGETRRSPGLPPGLVYVQNDTGDDLGRFAVVGIQETTTVVDVIDNEIEFTNHPVLVACSPLARLDAPRVAILTEPLANGAFGIAQVAGVTPCKVNIVDLDHTAAGPTDGVTDYLTSAPTGPARILWAEPGTGPLWAIVLLDDRTLGFWAELTAEASGGGGYYSWAALKADAETFAGYTGTDDLKEVSEREGIATGTIIWAWPDPGSAEYRFSLPATPGGGPGGTSDHFSVRFAVDAGTHNGVVVSTADWRGRTLAWSMAQELAVDAGTCDDLGAWETNDTGLRQAYIASRCTGAQDLETFSPADGGSARLYVDGTDGGQLKIDFTNIPDGGGGEGSYGWNLVVSLAVWPWTGETPVNGWTEVG